MREYKDIVLALKLSQYVGVIVKWNRYGFICNSIGEVE